MALRSTQPSGVVWVGIDRSGYTDPDAVTEGGGYLTLHTYTTNGVNYSPIISSDARFRMRYGYTESSVEFNGSPGMFSDFWLQSPDNGAIIGDPAASGAEIDVCEHRATDANDADDISGMVTIDLHWDGYTSGVGTFDLQRAAWFRPWHGISHVRPALEQQQLHRQHRRGADVHDQRRHFPTHRNHHVQFRGGQ